MKVEDKLAFIDFALKLNNIKIHETLLIKVVTIIDIINKKGKKTTTKDVILKNN